MFSSTRARSSGRLAQPLLRNRSTFAFFSFSPRRSGGARELRPLGLDGMIAFALQTGLCRTGAGHERDDRPTGRAGHPFGDL